LGQTRKKGRSVVGRVSWGHDEGVLLQVYNRILLGREVLLIVRGREVTARQKTGW